MEKDGSTAKGASLPGVPDDGSALAVLVSGGLDSAILLGDALAAGHKVLPLYVRCGMTWEDAELAHLRRYLEALGRSGPKPLTVLDVPVTDLYDSHWSTTGRDVPAADTPDEAVYLPGRNVLLLGKALLWCHLHDVPALALGVLGSNPFPDATTAFFRLFETAVNQAVHGNVRILRPFGGLHKTEVMRRGAKLPLALTFSCIHPVGGRHCGRCNKCAERRHAFADAGMADPTPYAAGNSCTA